MQGPGPAIGYRYVNQVGKIYDAESRLNTDTGRPPLTPVYGEVQPGSRYTVGYGRPPQAQPFKPGNPAIPEAAANPQPEDHVEKGRRRAGQIREGGKVDECQAGGPLTHARQRGFKGDPKAVTLDDLVFWQSGYGAEAD